VALVPLATLALGLAFASMSFAQNAITDWHAVMETTVAATGRKNVGALPLKLTSPTWARDFNLTKDYGALNSAVRTSAQTEIGLF